jgi:hypothetical protein
VKDLNSDIVRNSSQSQGFGLRRVPAAIAGFALFLGLVLVPVGGGSAATVPAPPPDVSMPDELDWAAEYHGTTLCHPRPKPGTLKLGALLDRTYGTYTKYYQGQACPYGLQHQEGRAIDWMVNSAHKNQKAKAKAFLAWLLADGPNGETAANARRLGIMYLIWNDRIWAIYRPNDGWRDYQNCTSSSKQSSGYNTSCHRDHIHISLSWDGANGQTSFWTGSAETRKPCPSSFSTRPGGTSKKSSTLLDTRTGTGVAAKNCRLAASAGSPYRSYRVKVPVPDVSPGTLFSQRVKIAKFRNNAPGDLRISGAQTVTIPHEAKLPMTVKVPLGSDGVIGFSLPGGHARVKAKGRGIYVEPPAVTTALNKSETWVNTKFKAAGVASSVPRSSSAVLQMKSGNGWVRAARQPVANGPYSFQAATPVDTGRFTYRVTLVKRGKRLALSAPVTLAVKPAEVKFNKILLTTNGNKARITGRVSGIAPDDQLIVRRRLAGESFTAIHTFDGLIGRFKTRVAVPVPGKYTFRVKLVDKNGDHVANSGRRGISVP